jgi:hypothetical protein
MKSLLIDRGVYNMTMCKKHQDGSEEVTEPGGWKSDPEGGSVVIGDIDSEEPLKIGNGTLTHIVQRHTIADIIAERLNLPPAEDAPDIKKVAKAMKADGLDICDYCPTIGAIGVCKMCVLWGYYEESED